MTRFAVATDHLTSHPFNTGIDIVVGVTFGALFSVAYPVRRSLEVVGLCDRLKVRGIDATSHAALVIKRKLVRQFVPVRAITETMRPDCQVATPAND